MANLSHRSEYIMIPKTLKAISVLIAICLCACDAPTSPRSESPEPPRPSPASIDQNPGSTARSEKKTVSEPAPKRPVRVSPDPVDLYELELDEATGEHFWDESRSELYSGPVYANYDSGTIEVTGTIIDGIENGWWVEYHENGNKLSEGNFVLGIEDGFWSYWWENGNLEMQGIYTDGSSTGKWVTYFEDGTRDSEGVYSDGLMDGDWIFYDQETGEKTTIRFEKGTKVSP